MRTYHSEATIKRITDYYLSDCKTKLSKHDEELLFRWRTAYSMLANQNGVEHETVKMLKKFHGISRIQAYRDVHNCLKCFGPIGGWDRQFVRYMVTQWAIECYCEANLKNDFEAMDLFLDRIIVANCLDKKDVRLPDPSKIQPPVQLLKVNYSFLKSEYFKLIDTKAQKALLNLHKKVVALIDESPLAEYKDILLAACDNNEDLIVSDESTVHLE